VNEIDHNKVNILHSASDLSHLMYLVLVDVPYNGVRAHLIARYVQAA
jgi:hypothetical protein